MKSLLNLDHGGGHKTAVGSEIVGWKIPISSPTVQFQSMAGVNPTAAVLVLTWDMALVHIHTYVIYHLPQKQWTPWLKALWLMSAALVGPALEVIREARWWFTSPSGSCPVAFFVLAAIVLCICSFTTGVLCGCCLSSRRCRVWLWHCISGLQELWVDSRGPAVTEVRRRLRDYRA